MSPAFRKYTRPVKPGVKRLVYAFVEIDKHSGGLSTFDFLAEDETAVIPVVIGKFTRKQLGLLTEKQMKERLSLVLPGTKVYRVAGYAHALTRKERKGMKFTKVKGKVVKRAPKRNRKARKTSNRRRNKSTKARTKG